LGVGTEFKFDNEVSLAKKLEIFKYHQKRRTNSFKGIFSTMSYILFYPKRNLRILFWLIDELKKQIPDFEVQGQDRCVLEFAYQDLQTCLETKWKITDASQLNIILTKVMDARPDEVKAFLKVWISKWLEKWRERVTLSQEMPKISKRRLINLRKAKRLYDGMIERQELKKLVVQKLVNQGEVCRAKLIAKNLIIKEIADQLKRRGKKKTEKRVVNPTEILHGVYNKVKRLANNKTAILHLKISKDKKSI
jgi:hypothetical protein